MAEKTKSNKKTSRRFDPEELRGMPTGRILVRTGLLTKDQVNEALDVQKKQGGPLCRVMMDIGMIDEDAKNLTLAYQMGMEYIDLDEVELDHGVLGQIDAQTANAYKIIPIAYDPAERHLTIAMSSPENFRATDDLKTLWDYSVTAKITSREAIEKALAKHYGSGADSITDLINEVATDETLAMLENRDESIDLDTLMAVAESNPVKRLVNMVLLEAIRNRASDVHFEPFEDEYKMRYRIDGVLYEMLPPPRNIAVAIASRIKVMSNLNIAERRIPQDGRIELVVNANPVDLRVSTLPTMFGESVVLRVLDRSNISLDVEKLGMRDEDIKVYRKLIHRPEGIVVVTGPTGSGKTTTLYSALAEVNDVSVKILTSEDPVEYDIDGLVQTQINDEIGLTFARCLRHFLRQDPDIILVGEMRDPETANIAVESALTGHLVFSTLHTNDAPSSVARLLELGLEPYLVSATVEAIIGQRLVRKICTNCKEAIEPTEEMLFELGLNKGDVSGKKFYRGTGCTACRNTGYSGRMAIYEIMQLDDNVRELINKRSSTNIIREEARKRGMRTLRESGLLAIFDGLTTIEEIITQTIAEEEDMG